jgi:hypothetical protein
LKKAVGEEMVRGIICVDVALPVVEVGTIICNGVELPPLTGVLTFFCDDVNVFMPGKDVRGTSICGVLMPVDVNDRVVAGHCEFVVVNLGIICDCVKLVLVVV